MKQRKKLLFALSSLTTIVMFLFSTTALGQSLSVKGRVVDKQEEPIIGASVLVEGTSNGTVTDLNGDFTLPNVPSKGKVKISYVGYTTQVIPINGRKYIAVTLYEDAEMLDEVVVVGYGVQKKVNLTGSVSSVNGEELSRRPVANVTQSLQGMVPGLTVTNGNSGRPGSSASLTLRGQGNLANTANPYVLVDGVEMNLSDVNPNDIENISVLKDAAACAIYGARAAYGVILVTTKKVKKAKCASATRELSVGVLPPFCPRWPMLMTLPSILTKPVLMRVLPNNIVTKNLVSCSNTSKIPQVLIPGVS